MPVRKSLVDRAIEFKSPGRIPIWVDGDHIKHSDILTYDLSLPLEDDPSKSEWGFARIRGENGEFQVPTDSFLPDWKTVDLYQPPQADYARRLAEIPRLAAVCEDRYRIASYGLSGYSVYSALRGADFSAVDFLVETDRFIEVMELIFEFESQMFDLLVRKGFHAVEFCDDWGPRGTSKITLSLWRCLLKNYYAREFRLARDSGLHIWFTTSSECTEFYGDLKEIGVDVVRIEKPYDVELANLGRQYRGKLCFAVRLDELITMQEDDEINVQHIFDCLAAPNGGFIATVADNVPEKKIARIASIAEKIKYQR
ncbi:MAG: hypothetical protein Q4G69_10645 [Planctomycetia bacterium]|nr:hypothetical protein [Planctomycetia bacterium]